VEWEGKIYQLTKTLHNNVQSVTHFTDVIMILAA